MRTNIFMRISYGILLGRGGMEVNRIIRFTIGVVFIDDVPVAYYSDIKDKHSACIVY